MNNLCAFKFSLISRFYFYFLYSPVYLRLGHVTESIGETGVCVADQPPAHGDHDLLTLIVSMTIRNHQTDSYKSAHKSVQHVVCNQFNSSWGCAATAVWGWSVERLLLVHCIYYDGGSRVRGTPADRHKWRKFPIIADRRRSLFAPCVNRILVLCCDILLAVHRPNINKYFKS